MNNERLGELFHLKRDGEGNVILRKDSETDIIVEFEDGHTFRIVCRGAGQRVRGLKWGHMRPDLIIGDDLENDEIVLNKDRRDKFKRWFTGALLPIRSDRGIVRIVGTILHMDSLLENLMPRAQLAVRKRVSELKTLPLKEWTDYRLPWKSVKYRAHDDTFEHLLWAEKKSRADLESIRSDYIAQGLPEVYAQEYLNVPLDESFAYFRRQDFVALEDGDRQKPVLYYITLDLAVSLEQRADYSVFVVGAIDSDRVLQIRNVIRERLDGKEIIEMILRLQQQYKPEAFGIEKGQIEKAIKPFLNEQMIQTGIFPIMYPLAPHQDKMTRARSIQGRMRARGVRFDKDQPWYQTLEDECLRFPRDKHDDQVDSLAYLGLLLDKLATAPTFAELREEAWDEEKQRTGYFDQGRSLITGY
jgi:predicted phage terminase large subunit-like protein